MIGRCVLKKAENRKTWFEVCLDGVYRGRVRTTFGGQEYLRPHDSEPLFAGSVWGNGDQKHALAILKLLEEKQ